VSRESLSLGSIYYRCLRVAGAFPASALGGLQLPAEVDVIWLPIEFERSTEVKSSGARVNYFRSR